MKQVQINKAFSGIPVSSPVNGVSVKVSAVGPLTVAVQLSISAASTPNTASGQLQGSLDGVNFFNVGSPVTIAGNGQLILKDVDVAFAHYRVAFAIASGSFEVVQTYFVYGSSL